MVKSIALANALGGLCRLWDVASGRELPALPLACTEEQVDPSENLKRVIVGTFAVAPDGRLLAQAQPKDHIIQLYASGRKEAIRELIGHKAQVLVLAFAADGKTLASAGEDQSLRLSEYQTGRLLRSMTGHRTAIRAVAFAADGQRRQPAAVQQHHRTNQGGAGTAGRFSPSPVYGRWKPTAQLLHFRPPRQVCRGQREF